MTLQAGIEFELPRLRAEATARMTSTCTVRRLAERAEQDEETGEEGNYWLVVYTDLPCRLVASRVGGASRTVTIGGTEIQQATPSLHFPWDTADLADGDYVALTGGENAGAVYQIVEATKGDQRTARRVPVVEANRPEEW